MGRELYLNGDRDDVRRRLTDTICMYKGEPVYVSSNRGHILTIYDLYKRDKGQVDYRSDDFDYRSIRLGYMNYNKQAFYVNRIPLRSNATWGVSSQNLSCSNGGRPPTTWGKEMIDCVMGTHPSLATAISNLRQKDWVSCAFHRHFAVARQGNDIILHHRDSPVAVYDKVKETFTIPYGARGIKTMKTILTQAGVPYT